MCMDDATVLLGYTTVRNDEIKLDITRPNKLRAEVCMYSNTMSLVALTMGFALSKWLTISMQIVRFVCENNMLRPLVFFDRVSMTKLMHLHVGQARWLLWVARARHATKSVPSPR